MCEYNELLNINLLSTQVINNITLSGVTIIKNALNAFLVLLNSTLAGVTKIRRHNKTLEGVTSKGLT